MWDIHRHQPFPGETPPPDDWNIWFATSGMEEWDRYKSMEPKLNHHHGYGILPQSMDPDIAIPTIVARLEEVVKPDRMWYLGEFGIDTRYSATVPLDTQMCLAETLLAWASSESKVAVLHHVGPMDLLERMLIKTAPTAPVVIHGYLKSVQQARRLYDLGAMVSIGPTLWSRRTKLGEHMKELDVPFLIETDYPSVPMEGTYRTVYTTHLERTSLLCGMHVGEFKEMIDGYAKILTNR
jgi:Tat protein secretion system quality control protein TatD with DNase activity